jgi:hypothetical protein
MTNNLSSLGEQMQRRIRQADGMKGAVARLKITLEDSEPAIWRRIEIKAATTLKMLHPIIQAAMGWEDDHLFHFKIGGYGTNGGRVSLADLAESGVKRFSYICDMGDGWEHDLFIEKMLPAEPDALYPRYIDGARRCPPEDVGGIPGFYAFLNALADPNDPDHEDRLEWHGGPFDENVIDEDQIRKDLAKIARRRQRKTANPKPA